MSSDFRSDAVTESLRLVAAHRTKVGRVSGAERIEHSYCLPIEGGEAFRLRQRKRTLYTVVSMIVGIAIGGVMGALLKYHVIEVANEWTLLSVALVFSLSGFAIGFYGLITLKRAARHEIGKRIGDPSGLLQVNLEDANTFQKLKAMPEDICLLVFHDLREILQIEGVTHRYLVRADDVIGLSSQGTTSSQAVIIHYRIGGTVLPIALMDSSLRVAFKRHFHMEDKKLFRRIEAVLPVALIES